VLVIKTSTVQYRTVRDWFQTESAYNLGSILRNVRDIPTNVRREKLSASSKNVTLLACLFRQLEQEGYFLLQSI